MYFVNVQIVKKCRSHDVSVVRELLVCEIWSKKEYRNKDLVSVSENHEWDLFGECYLHALPCSQFVCHLFSRPRREQVDVGV